MPKIYYNIHSRKIKYDCKIHRKIIVNHALPQMWAHGTPKIGGVCLIEQENDPVMWYSGRSEGVDDHKLGSNIKITRVR